MANIVRGYYRQDSKGNALSFVHSSNGLLYARARKPYTRKHPYPQNTYHFKALPNEKPAIIKLRRLGYSINHLSMALGRSLSFIHRVLKNARQYFPELRFDKRKLPRRVKLLGSRKGLKMAYYWLSRWEAFILGVEGEPP